MRHPRNLIARGLSWSISANSVVNTINVLGLLVFARLLGVETIGHYGVVLVAVDVLALVVNFGFNQAVIKYGDDQGVFSAALTLIVVQSIALLLIFVIAIKVGNILGLDSLILGAPAALLVLAKIFSFFATLSYAPLESQIEYAPIARSRVFATVLAMALGISLALIGERTVYVLIARDLASTLLMLILILPNCPLKMRPSLVAADIRRVWRFTRPIWHLNLLDRGSLRGDYVLAAYALDQTSFGIYFQVRALVEGALGFIVNPIQTVVYAFYCKLDNRLLVFHKFVKRWFVPVLLMTLFTSAVLAMTDIPGNLIEFLYGFEWRDGGLLLSGFCLYAASMIVFEHSKVISIAESRQGTALVGRILQLVLIALLVVPLAQAYGLRGASWASGIAALGLAVVPTLTLLKSKRALAGGQT